MAKQKYSPNEKFGFTDLDGASAITGWSKSSLYKAVSKGVIAFYKPNGRLLFKIDELIKWIEKSRIPAISE